MYNIATAALKHCVAVSFKVECSRFESLLLSFLSFGCVGGALTLFNEGFELVVDIISSFSGTLPTMSRNNIRKPFKLYMDVCGK